jgi:hypothetical protein
MDEGHGETPKQNTKLTGVHLHRVEPEINMSERIVAKELDQVKNLYH